MKIEQKDTAGKIETTLGDGKIKDMPSFMGLRKTCVVQLGFEDGGFRRLWRNLYSSDHEAIKAAREMEPGTYDLDPMYNGFMCYRDDDGNLWDLVPLGQCADEVAAKLEEMRKTIEYKIERARFTEEELRFLGLEQFITDAEYRKR